MGAGAECAGGAGGVMSDLEHFGVRLEALESHIAHQDQVIADLNSTITAQWKKIDALARHVSRLEGQVQEASDSAMRGIIPEKPPHY